MRSIFQATVCAAYCMIFTLVLPHPVANVALVYLSIFVAGCLKLLMDKVAQVRAGKP